jgi:hypothetical protein
MSIESLLSRLSPKSNGYEPTIPGARPEITREDVLQALSGRYGNHQYQLLAAKYLSDGDALSRVEGWLPGQVWADWFRYCVRHGRMDLSVTPGTIDNVARAILGLYIRQTRYDGKPWSDEDVAAACGVHVNTYRKRYRDFLNRVVTRLHAEEQNTIKQMRRRLSE